MGTHNDGPRQLKTTKIYRLGASDAVALPDGAHPATISVDKRGAGYSAAVYTSTKVDASPYAGGDWDVLEADSTSDVTETTLPVGARVVMVRVSAITEALPSKNPLRMVIGTSKEQGWNNKQRSNYGYQGHNALTVVGSYIDMVVADMAAAGAGDFFPLQDGLTGTAATNLGPTGDTFQSTSGVAAELDGPWTPAQAQGRASGRFGYMASEGQVSVLKAPAAQEFSFDGWFLQNSTHTSDPAVLVGTGGDTTITGISIHSQFTSGLVRIQANGQTTDFANFPVWAAATVYAKGARVAHSTQPAGMLEAEVGGTSAGSEPANPSVGSTVVDNTVTWRNVANNTRDFNDDGADTSFTITNGEWFHTALVRRAADGGDLLCYVNGTLRGRLDVPAFETTPGSFGSPRPREFVFGYGNGMKLGEATAGFDGKAAFIAFSPFALTENQITERYQRGVDLGFIDLE